MGALGKLLALIAGKYVALTLAIQASAVARRLIFVGWLGALYLSCVLTFSNMISPWFSALLQWGPGGVGGGSAAGNVIGLLFPPVAGTVLGSLAVFWGCVAALRYTSKLSTIVFKD
jgi:hypothetical protein